LTAPSTIERCRVCTVVWLGLSLLSSTLCAGELIDWVVAIVGNNAVTSSEVALQLRLEAFLNKRPIDDSSQTSEQQVAERLIEVNLIEKEMRMTNFLPVKDEEIEKELQALQRQDYLNRRAFMGVLERYALTERDLRTFLRRQMNVLRFIDFRFRTGLDVDKKTVETYYKDIYKISVQQLEGRDPEPLEEVHESLKEIILQTKVDELLDDWLKLLRTTTRVEYVRVEPEVIAN
jgi:peptidyl-prolyl cis-trans isomerase SurA